MAKEMDMRPECGWNIEHKSVGFRIGRKKGFVLYEKSTQSIGNGRTERIREYRPESNVSVWL